MKKLSQTENLNMKDFAIVKRDGSKDRFSLDKIMNAILKAFESVNEDIDLASVSKIVSHIDVLTASRWRIFRTRWRRL